MSKGAFSDVYDNTHIVRGMAWGGVTGASTGLLIGLPFFLIGGIYGLVFGGLVGLFTGGVTGAFIGIATIWYFPSPTDVNLYENTMTLIAMFVSPICTFVGGLYVLSPGRSSTTAIGVILPAIISIWLAMRITHKITSWYIEHRGVRDESGIHDAQ